MKSIIPSFRAAPCFLAALSLFSGCSTDDMQIPLESAAPVGSPAFAQGLGNSLGAPFLPGHRITTLLNGDEIFPAMLRGIRGAQRTITFETFVYWKGEVPAMFAEALAERARAGVKVKLLLDAHGARKSRDYHSLMKDAGVEIENFHPIWIGNPLRYNNRTHRKLLVIDGRVGFIGGVGIADEWAGDAQSPEHWRDNHYRVEGPAVAQMQGAFAANWLKARGEILEGPGFFPAPASPGKMRAMMFYASPLHGDLDVIRMYHQSIAAARSTVSIENPYFVPDQPLTDALILAAQRGVRVRIIMPGRHIDWKSVRRASRKRWPELLRAGVELYEYEPTMIHTKLMIVDGRFVSVGSANFDGRSLRLNDEANLNVLDAKFAAEQTRIFEDDLAKSIRVTEENLDSESLAEAPMAAAQTPVEGQL